MPERFEEASLPGRTSSTAKLPRLLDVNCTDVWTETSNHYRDSDKDVGRRKDGIKAAIFLSFVSHPIPDIFGAQQKRDYILLTGRMSF